MYQLILVNKRGQVGEALVSLVAGAIILAFSLTLLSAISCTSEKNTIAQLNADKSNLEASLIKAEQDRDYFASKLVECQSFNVTKEDVEDLNAGINNARLEITHINNNLTAINQKFENTYAIWNLTFWFNLALFPITLFTLIDVAILNFKYSKKIRNFTAFIKAKLTRNTTIVEKDMSKKEESK